MSRFQAWKNSTTRFVDLASSFPNEKLTKSQATRRRRDRGQRSDSLTLVAASPLSVEVRAQQTPRIARLLGVTEQSVVEETPQLPASARMLQLPQRLRLDLPDTFARNTELLADFFQRVVGVHADAEAHAEHTFF